MYCPKCAARLVDEANFCHHCGASVAEAAGSFTAPDSSLRMEDSARDDRWTMTDSSSREADEPLNPPPSGESEQEIWEGRLSPKAMAASFSAFVAATIGLLVASVFSALYSGWLLTTILLLAVPVLWLVQLARLVKRCLGVYYRLTDRRLIFQIGLLHCHKDQLELARVDDVRIIQSVLDRFFDVGSIEIHSSDRRIRRLVMEGLDGPDQLAETIRFYSRRLHEKPRAPAERVSS